MRCICLDKLPIFGGTIGRPNPNCSRHKTLAERWERIKTWRAMYDALAADNPDIEPYEVWRAMNN
jgi:hypothetical protein